MLPQFPLSKVSTDAPTCLKDKLENMGRLKKAVSISRVRTVTPIENTGTYRDPNVDENVQTILPAGFLLNL